MKERTYQFSIGEYQGVVIFDAASEHTVDELIVNPSIEEIEKIAPDYNLKLPNIPGGVSNLLLRTGDRNILIDAGIPKPAGEINLGLAELNISPNDIDMIVVTHSDIDHVGGLVDNEGRILYPNARYIILKEMWEYWSSVERRIDLTKLNRSTEENSQFVWNIFSKVKRSIQVVESEEEFLPGLKLLFAPGHRYDHSIVELISSNARLIHLADAVIHPLFMEKIEWYTTFDANPTQAIETKQNVLERCSSSNALVFATHFPFPGLGYVFEEQDHWRWKPL